jgi:DNA-binding winged helix-turn-helix (wHTH) protein
MRFTFGTFVLDLDQRRLFDGGAEVHLQPKAFELLRRLVEARPRALSKDELLTAIWPGVFVSENNLATVVRDLRTALGDDAQEPRYVRTVYGYGYAFASPVIEDAPAAVDVRGLSAWRLIHDHREIVLLEGLNRLGRAGADVIVLDSPTVSRHHAAVRVRGERATVEDLGSKNGTWIGEARITAPTPLVDGQALRLGSVRLTVAYLRHEMSTQTVAID